MPEDLFLYNCLLQALSREGFVVAHFPGGHVASFTANGNLLRHEMHNDKIQGRTDGKDEIS